MLRFSPHREKPVSSAAPQSALAKPASVLVAFLLLMTLWIAAPRVALAQTPTATPVPTDAEEDDWARVKEEGKLVVGTSGDYPPFEYYNSNFELDGFDIALMEEIGERLNLEIVWNDFAFSGLLDALTLGQVDAAISAISVTPDRAGKVDFTSLYLSANDAVLVRTGEGITVRSPSDFAGHTVGVEKGTTYQAWAQKNLVDAGIITQTQLIPIESIDLLVAALEDEEIDIALLGYAPAQTYDRKSALLTVGGTKFNTQQFAVATRKGSTLLNHMNVALAEVMTDGTWDDLIAQYLAVDSAVVLPPPGEDGTQSLVPTATSPAAPTSAATTTQSATEVAVTTPSATGTPTPLPATATPLPTASPTPTTVVCVNGLGFVSDVNLDDKNMTSPAVLSPGQNFTKTWRVRNTGNCAWDADYLLIYINGNRTEAQMNAQPTAIGQVVEPGEEVDISVNLTAPYTYGTFQGFFQMRDNKGVYFGQVVWVGVNVPDPNPPTATPVPTTAPPASQSPNPNFRIDNAYITGGECTTLRWDVDNVSAVYFIDSGNAQGKGGHDAATVCPGQTTTYELQVVTGSSQVYSFYQTVNVSGSTGYTISFTADSTSINEDECTTLRWTVQSVQAVYLDGNGVAGVSSTDVCPDNDTIYTLVAVKYDGSQDSRQIRIVVDDDDDDDDDDDSDDNSSGDSGTSVSSPASKVGAPRIDWFKVSKNTIANGQCVELNWRVSDASGVNISRSGTYIVQGGSGDDEVKDCPPGPGVYDYTIEVYGSRGNNTQKVTVEVRE